MFGHGDAIAYVVEFGALAVIGVLMLSLYQKATAQRYLGEASAAGPNAWAALELNAGNSLIDAMQGWATRVPSSRGPALFSVGS